MKRALVLPAIRMRHLRDSRWSVFRGQVRGCANHRRWRLASQRHFLPFGNYPLITFVPLTPRSAVG